MYYTHGLSPPIGQQVHMCLETDIRTQSQGQVLQPPHGWSSGGRRGKGRCRSCGCGSASLPMMGHLPESSQTLFTFNFDTAAEQRALWLVLRSTKLGRCILGNSIKLLTVWSSLVTVTWGHSFKSLTQMSGRINTRLYTSKSTIFSQTSCSVELSAFFNNAVNIEISRIPL